MGTVQLLKVVVSGLSVLALFVYTEMVMCYSGSAPVILLGDEVK